MARPRWTILTDTMNGYEPLIQYDDGRVVTYATLREARRELDIYVEMMRGAWGVGLSADTDAEFIITNGTSQHYRTIRI